MIYYEETHTYKYILKRDYRTELPHGILKFVRKNPQPETAKFLSIENGVLHIKAGYRWDGPSGPTFDTRNFMRGSLGHDALYQLQRDGCLSRDAREEVDILLRKHCREDGMSPVRAWWVFRGVRAGGQSSTKPVEYELLTAP